MVSGILRAQLWKTVLTVLFGLILFGAAPAFYLVSALALFCAWRLTALAAAARRKTPLPEQDWAAQETEWRRLFESVTEAERNARAAALRLHAPASPEALATATVQALQRQWRAPRGSFDLLSEALGAVGFSLLLPGTIAWRAFDFFSLRIAVGWAGAAVAGLCVALYALPHLWSDSPARVLWRKAWWASPFLPLLLLFHESLENRHPYLDPFRADHAKLAAERVLALRENIIAARHTGWLVRYGRELERAGRETQAAEQYRYALRLEPGDSDARSRLMSLEHREPPLDGLRSKTASDKGQWAPYWDAKQPIPPAPRIQIDAQLNRIDGCMAVLVPVGDVPDHLLDSTAYAIRRELGVPAAVRSKAAEPLEHTRVRGLVIGKQWDAADIVRAYQKAGDPDVDAPVRYILITPKDIYIGSSNFAFSAAWEWGGVVSFARFGPAEPDSLCSQRTAKAALCVLLKSFKILPSAERECVTSYANSLEEFDAKGNRPVPETLAQFKKAVTDINAGWLQYRDQHGYR